MRGRIKKSEVDAPEPRKVADEHTQIPLAPRPWRFGRFVGAPMPDSPEDVDISYYLDILKGLRHGHL
jgi:hypothetical protein